MSHRTPASGSSVRTPMRRTHSISHSMRTMQRRSRCPRTARNGSAPRKGASGVFFDDRAAFPTCTCVRAICTFHLSLIKSDVVSILS